MSPSCAHADVGDVAKIVDIAITIDAAASVRRHASRAPLAALADRPRIALSLPRSLPCPMLAALTARVKARRAISSRAREPIRYNRCGAP
ncbi:MAG: hypothetical protein V4793_18500 [Paraburkholderia tropica]